MSDDLGRCVDQIFMFARYLSWADLQNRLFEEEIDKGVDSTDATALNEHEWRWFGLMCYWYSSLHVVIEAWDQIGFSDPVIDRLLDHPKQFRTLLRRHRNAVFHYQQSMLDPKFVDLLANGATHVYWVRALHDEFVRFFAEYLSVQMATDFQRVEFREDIQAVIHWYPYRDHPQRDSLERILSHMREILVSCPNDHSEEREEIRRTLEAGEKALREGKRNWAALRAHILREAGIK